MFSAVVLKVVFPRSAASISPGNLLEMQILWPHPRPTESETLGVRLRHLCFDKSSRWFWFKFWNHWPRGQSNTVFSRKTLSSCRIFCFIFCLPRLLTPKGKFFLSWCPSLEVKRLFCAWGKSFAVSCSWGSLSRLLLATHQGTNVPGDAAAARFNLNKGTWKPF